MYIIAAKNILENLDATNPWNRTEICTEMVYTRLKIIELLNTNKINKNNTIVTLKDRKCLYENLFDNVIDWNEFVDKNIPTNEILDLVAKLDSLFGIIQDEYTVQHKPKYKRLKFDINEISNINFSNLEQYTVDKPFICLIIRKKLNLQHINLSEKFWNDFINLVDKKINIFIFGQNINDKLNTNNVFYIDKFQDWCSLLHNENCKMLISSICGAITPIFQIGHKRSKLILIDEHEILNELHGDPSFYGNCVNYTKTKITKITSTQPKILLSTINKYL